MIQVYKSIKKLIFNRKIKKDLSIKMEDAQELSVEIGGKVLLLRSGNTFRAVSWSQIKRDKKNNVKSLKKWGLHEIYNKAVAVYDCGKLIEKKM